MAELAQNGTTAGSTARTFLQLKKQEDGGSAPMSDYEINP
jgi:hypothetical protein